MKAARLYDNEVEFAEMMARRLGESVDAKVEVVEGEPLLLDVVLGDDPQDKVRISLHSTHQTYRVSGDLNRAIEYLNGIIRTSKAVREKTEVVKLDGSYIFPAIRDERYVSEAGMDMGFISDPYLPGLRIIYLEIKNPYSKIVTESLLQHNPKFTVERIKRLAYRNLRAAGWVEEKMALPSPARKTCTIDVFADNPHPIECQFLLPELAVPNMPRNCVVAFTNRHYAVRMRTSERMETMEDVKRLVRMSMFTEVVKRSCAALPSPVSDRMYWIRDGVAELVV